jgi:hypothetical protein
MAKAFSGREKHSRGPIAVLNHSSAFRRRLGREYGRIFSIDDFNAKLVHWRSPRAISNRNYTSWCRGRHYVARSIASRDVRVNAEAVDVVADPGDGLVDARF